MREMMVRKELGYLPKNAEEMAFISEVIFEIKEKEERSTTKNKLQSLIQKNK